MNDANAKLSDQGANGMNRAVLIAPEKTVRYYNQCADQLTQTSRLLHRKTVRLSKETRFWSVSLGGLKRAGNVPKPSQLEHP